MRRFLAILIMFSVSGFAVAEDLNCKLVVHTTFKDEKRKLEVLEVHTDSAADCKDLAKFRELDSSNEAVKRTRVSFGWHKSQEEVY